MDIDLEIHAPGLDLHKDRWNNHVLFMDQVHTYVDRLAALAWERYQQEGRGSLYVRPQQWMQVIRSSDWAQQELFPCSFVAAGKSAPGVDFGILRAGYLDMVKEYRPETHLVLTVHHHPGGLLSSYLIRAEPAPPEAHRTYQDADTGTLRIPLST